MYYKSEVEGVVRVSPELFAEDLNTAIFKQLKKDHEGEADIVLGRVLAVLEVDEIGEGILIPGDGAAYYRAKFKVLNFLPEIQEMVEGEIKDIAKFGVFVDFGPFEGMVHISQTMDDFVTLDEKQHTLIGKETKQTLKVGDAVRSRVVAVSYKDPSVPKIGLTMRQIYLGKPEWWAEDKKKKVVKKTEIKKKGEK